MNWLKNCSTWDFAILMGTCGGGGGGGVGRGRGGGLGGLGGQITFAILEFRPWRFGLVIIMRKTKTKNLRVWKSLCSNEASPERFTSELNRRSWRLLISNSLLKVFKIANCCGWQMIRIRKSIGWETWTIPFYEMIYISQIVWLTTSSVGCIRSQILAQAILAQAIQFRLTTGNFLFPQKDRNMIPDLFGCRPTPFRPNMLRILAKLVNSQRI